jgi:hypothetical protein
MRRQWTVDHPAGPQPRHRPRRARGSSRTSASTWLAPGSWSAIAQPVPWAVRGGAGRRVERPRALKWSRSRPTVRERTASPNGRPRPADAGHGRGHLLRACMSDSAPTCVMSRSAPSRAKAIATAPSDLRVTPSEHRPLSPAGARCPGRSAHRDPGAHPSPRYTRDARSSDRDETRRPVGASTQPYWGCR